VHIFDTIEDLRRGLRDFVAHYNATWLVARHGYAPRTRSAPSNAALLKTHRPTYPWPPE
jgi:hypothetical protein